MKDSAGAPAVEGHSHVFLGSGHEQNERKTWAVIILCTVMMVVEIVGGSLFGSLALVADGMHMSTHAGAMLIAALAYTYARRHAGDERFVFGTGKLGDLAGFTSAIVLAMIALLIGYEAVTRFVAPVAIHFNEAIPIACVALLVNLASAWLLAGGDHHEHAHGHTHARKDAAGVHERHREHEHGDSADHSHGADHEHNADHDHGDHDHADPDHDHAARHDHPAVHDHASAHDHPGAHDHDHPVAVGPVASAHRDNNIRSAYVHVIADAAVSVLAIVGLLLARGFGWLWMDPLAGIIGALVIANWSFTLIRDTGSILLDMNPDRFMTERLRKAIEHDGDRLIDLHLWRLGPGHLCAVVSVVTAQARNPGYYRERLERFKSLSHITVEVTNAKLPGGEDA
jgi:cation diffusion facilitator family transporter